MEKRLILSRIQCSKCNDIITSYHTHDYVTCKCGANFLDGGNDYQRYNLNPEAPFTDLSVWSDAPWEKIRESFHRGGRGKNGDEPLKWTPMSEMSNNWLENCIIYNEKHGRTECFANDLYKGELEYRIVNNINIED
jgi:hypothetical protein